MMRPRVPVLLDDKRRNGKRTGIDPQPTDFSQLFPHLARQGRQQIGSADDDRQAQIARQLQHDAPTDAMLGKRRIQQMLTDARNDVDVGFPLVSLQRQMIGDPWMPGRGQAYPLLIEPRFSIPDDF